jgi:hypothetical protein
VSNNQYIAETILQQLGGNAFRAMTGARAFVAISYGLQFHLPTTRHFVKRGINVVRITLTPMDVYDMEFGKIQGFDYAVLKTVNGVYCDQLQSVFTEVTGLDTHL